MNDEQGNIYTAEGPNGKMNVFNAPVYGATIPMTDDEIIQVFHSAGALIRNYRCVVADDYHIERPETTDLFNWLKHNNTEKERVCALLGNAGQGKTVIMRDLLLKLEAEGIPTLAIKADAFAVENSFVLKSELGLRIEVIDALRQLASTHKLVVLIIDQIDALSMSLSSDRSPLKTYHRLIQMAASIGNIKIALSCRSFDWDYDSTLSDYRRFSNTFRLYDLPLANVEEALKRIGDDIKMKSPTLQAFLCNPLHLYLYCRLHGYVKNDENVTLTDLYNKLWNDVVLSANAEGNNVACLGFISKEMYDKQALHLASQSVDSKFHKEKSYLASNNFLCEEEGVRKTVQFIHQSLFDYVYARLYFESGNSLIDDILKEHQGLFIRARIKQYFQYLRDVDHVRYINEFTAFITNPDIRYHIKHLLITWLGSQAKPMQQELLFAEKHIITEPTNGNTLVISARSSIWFEFLASKLNILDGVVSGNQDSVEQAQTMFYAIGSDNSQSDCLITFLSRLVDADSESAHKFIGKNFERIQNYSSPALKTLFQQITNAGISVTAHDYLEHKVTEDPQLVGDYIVKDVANKTAGKPVRYGSFRWDYGTNDLYEKLCKTDWKIATWVSLRCIECLSDNTAYLPKIDGVNLKISAEYYLYERNGSYIDSPDEWVNYVRKKLKEADMVDLPEYVDFLKNSKQEITKLILADLYNSRLDDFYADALQLITDLDVLVCATETTKYYLFQLVKSVFDIANDDNRHTIINAIKQVNSPGENLVHKPFYPGGPANYRGYTRCEFYMAIGKENLRNYDREAYKEYQEILRRFPYINNDRPGGIQTQVGWRGIKQQALDRMSDEDLLTSMHNVKDDITADFEKPTPQGLAMQLKDMAVKDYDRFKVLLEKTFAENVDFIYKHEILKGLMESKQIRTCDISILYQRLIDEEKAKAPSDANLISLVRCLKYYTESRWQIPDGILDFVCGVAKEYDDSKEHSWDDKEGDLFNTGINQVRGCAANYLTHYTYQDDGLPRVIDALNSVAETGTPPTRSAMLLELGFLSNKNIEAMAEIYIKAVTRDYHQSLLHIPLYRCNPLVVLLSLRFDLIESFLWDVVNGDYANDDFASICWIGWLWGNPPCKDMLLALLAKSSKARLNWLRFVSQEAAVNHKDEYLEVMWHIMPFVDKEFAKTFDGHFDDIQKVVKDWTELESLCDKFVNSGYSAYAAHYFIEFIERNTALYPEKCLEWTMAMIDKGTDEEQDHTLSRLVDLMLNAYNTLRAYNKGNAQEEDAMTVFDTLLADTNRNRNLVHYLSKLDE